jgi:hypothetical protein
VASASQTANAHIEQSRGWLNLFVRILLPLGLFAIAVFGGGVNAAHAAAPEKVAKDLKTALATTGAKARWIASTSRGTYVQVVIAANSTDPALTSLRSAVLAAGGSVFYAYQSTPALLAVLPAGAGQRHRRPQRRFDHHPQPVRLPDCQLRPGHHRNRGVRASNPTGLSGAGIGIAILDSGIDSCHAGFRRPDEWQQRNCKTGPRFGASVDFTRLSAAQSSKSMDWTKPVDLSAGYAPGSQAYKAFQNSIDGSKVQNPDLYGHGTHVASVAGSQSFGTLDSAGIAPGATLLDVRVLNEHGVGQLSDVLAGIDWAVANRKQYNIRVLNLSLSTPSVGSFLSDPLCRAVRAATSLGIVVGRGSGQLRPYRPTAGKSSEPWARPRTSRRPSPWARRIRTTP